MNSAARMALVAGAAYPLGRYHKLRWALALAVVGATGRLESPGHLAVRGLKGLATSAELTELTETLRGELVDAAQAAAVSAARSSIASLTGRLNDQTEALRRPGGRAAEGVRKATPRSSSEDDGYEADDAEEAEAADANDEARRRPGRPASEGRREGRDHEDGGPEGRRHQAGASDDGEGENRVQRRRAPSAGDGGGPPVRRRG